MENDTQRALQMFYELRKDLIKSEDVVKLKQLNQLISLLESSFFNKIVVLHKSLDELKRQKNLKSTDIQFEETSGALRSVGVESPLPNDSKVLPLSLDDFNARVQALVGSRELIRIHINKTSPNQTLGFSINCTGSMHSNGIFVEEVTHGSLAESCGIKPQYQIVAIDGVPLDNPDSNKDIAVQALKSSHTKIEMCLAREKIAHHVSPSKDFTHMRNRSDMMFTKELNTEWTQYEIIELRSIDGTFGFGIMGGLTSDVMVRTILSGGAADSDGRLCVNDHIMFINQHPVRNLSSNQVAEMLKSAGDNVRLIVARPFDQSSNVSGIRVQMVETTDLDARLEMIVRQLYHGESEDMNPNDHEDNQSVSSYGDDNEDYAEFHVIDIPMSQSPLGITIISTTSGGDIDPSGSLDGVFVKEVIAGSVASELGIKKYDRILKINDSSVDNKRQRDSIDRLLNSSQCYNLHLQRYISGPTFDKLMSSDAFKSKTISSIDKKHSLEKMRSMKIHSRSESSDGSNVTDVDDFEDEHFLKPLSSDERIILINKWKGILGGNNEIIIAEFSKFSSDGGLGISLEGTVDIDDSGLEVHPHHYVRSIVESGPAGRCGQLREKDELIEANGISLYGVNHLEAVNILKNISMSVRLVCARKAQNNVNHYFYAHEDMSVEADKLCQDLDDIIAFETGSRSMYSIKSKSQDDLDEWPKEDGRIKDSTSRSRSLDQVHGLAIWDREITYVELEKRSNGLGFSILDYQDPVNPQHSVIVIRSLVPNGAAAKDKRIFPGDRLMSVNDTDVSRVTMTEAVDALKRTEPGLVRLGIVKALCLDPNNSQQVSFAQSENIIDDELEDPLTEHDLVSLFDEIEFPSPPLPFSSCPVSMDPVHQLMVTDPLLSVGGDDVRCNNWVTFNDSFEQSPDSHVIEQCDNVSSPQLLEDFENDMNLEEFNWDPIPEALEHKIRVQKLSGQPLGLKLECEGGHSHNENGLRIVAISSGSPAEKCCKLAVGDFVTKIDESSLRNSDEDDVAAILRAVTSCDGDIRISFIPETDYQIFVQSKTMQVNFRRQNDHGKSDDIVGFFPKPSAIKASGGKLLFANNRETVNTKPAVVDEVVPIVNGRRISRITSLVDLYDARMLCDERNGAICRQESALYRFDITDQ